MAAAGSLARDRVAFQAEANTPDDAGGNALGWATVATVWATFRPASGSERLEGGRLEATAPAMLTVRSTAATRAITTEHRAMIGGTPYQIRSIVPADRRNRLLEMVLEKGDERGVGT